MTKSSTGNDKIINMNKKLILLLSFLPALQLVAYGQQVVDTAAIIKEYNKVMSFTARPFVHYTTVTRLDAKPIVQAEDTMRIQGEFFKNNTDIYSNNEREELYIQDSLMVSINNDRKTIWLNKIDMSSKSKMNMLPGGGKEIQELMQKNYVISKSEMNKDVSRIIFETKRPPGSTAVTNTTISIDYNSKTYLPLNILIDINLKQPADEETLALLKEQHVNENELVQKIDGVMYVVRKQTMNIAFTSINEDKQLLVQMPAYNACLDYNYATGEFTGKGKYKDYEVTQLF